MLLRPVVFPVATVAVVVAAVFLARAVFTELAELTAERDRLRAALEAERAACRVLSDMFFGIDDEIERTMRALREAMP